jgi:hypothetical protein
MRRALLAASVVLTVIGGAYADEPDLDHAAVSQPSSLSPSSPSYHVTDIVTLPLNFIENRFGMSARRRPHCFPRVGAWPLHLCQQTQEATAQTCTGQWYRIR